MPVSRFMTRCLYDAEEGYYRIRRPFGRKGDFITAPEISQVFGEILGLWTGVVWQQMGCPAPCNLVELGPGRGTLMHDMLRALRIVPGASEALKVSLVEISEALRAEQAAILRSDKYDIAWPAGIDDIDCAPTILIANEYLDALPIEQWMRVAHEEGTWQQRGVCIDENGEFVFTSIDRSDGAPSETMGTLNKRFANANIGDIAEVRQPSTDLRLLNQFQDAGLVALFIDYGHTASATGDTLQAVSRHKAVSPLHEPGKVDVTAQVDFAALGETMREVGWTVDGPILQADLLGTMGILERTDRLMGSARQNDEPGQVQLIESGTQRLMAVPGMGDRFKALAIRSPHLPPPPPFDVVVPLKESAGQ